MAAIYTVISVTAYFTKHRSTVIVDVLDIGLSKALNKV